MRRALLAATLLIAGCGPRALTPGGEAMVYLSPEILRDYPGLERGPLDPGTFRNIAPGTKVRIVGTTTVRSGTYSVVYALDGEFAGRTLYVRPDYLKPL